MAAAQLWVAALDPCPDTALCVVVGVALCGGASALLACAHTTLVAPHLAAAQLWVVALAWPATSTPP